MIENIVSKSTKKITKGGIVVFVGTGLGMVFTFVSKVLIARSFSPSQYGLFSLAFAVLTIFTIISTLGLPSGTARYIAYFRGKNKDSKIHEVISSSIWLGLIGSVLSFLLLFFSSEWISLKIFHDTSLSKPLKIFSFAIPASTLLYIFSSILRGFNRVEGTVYFHNILRRGIFPLLLVPVVAFNLTFPSVFYTCLASFVIACIALIVYAVKKFRPSLRKTRVIDLKTRRLLLFSLPLLGSSILGMIMAWTDTLMLGYFMSSSEVGLYNGALPFAKSTTVFVASAAFLYVPVVSELHAQGLTTEIRRNYTILTKWLFITALSACIVMLVFPQTLLRTLFGTPYIKAANALQILSVGMFFQVFLGLNGPTLITFGRTRLHLIDDSVGVVVNIALNTLLIPKLGIIGAAIATTSSIAIIRIIMGIQLYICYGLHSFTKNFLRLERGEIEFLSGVAGRLRVDSSIKSFAKKFIKRKK